MVVNDLTRRNQREVNKNENYDTFYEATTWHLQIIKYELRRFIARECLISFSYDALDTIALDVTRLCLVYNLGYHFSCVTIILVITNYFPDIH